MQNRFGGLLIGVIVVVVGCLMSVTLIEDGEVGVLTSFGRISDTPLTTGFTLNVPVLHAVSVWNVKFKERKETASVPSSEGLISGLDVSLIYRINPASAPRVRKALGWGFEENVLEPYMREAIRMIVSGYPAKALFSEEGRTEIGHKIKEYITSKLGDYFEIRDVLLRDVKLPDSFARSIQQKLETEQQALQKEFELQKARKDAEIEVARAEGVAKANRIIAASIEENYIRYLWVSNLKSSQFQTIYVPTEAGLPILEAGRRTGAGVPRIALEDSHS